MHRAPLPHTFNAYLLALFLLFNFLPATADADGHETEIAIQYQLQQIALRGKTAGLDQPVRQREILAEVYSNESFVPLWTRPKQIAQLFAAISDSRREGLRPEDYHHQALLVLNRMLARNPSALLAAELDILLSDALLSLAHDRLFGKVDPLTIGDTWNFSPDRREAVVHPLLAALREDRLPRLLAELSPSVPFYTDLVAALARYRSIADRGGWPQIPAGPSLNPGVKEPRVEALRRRLLVTGELSHPGPAPMLFDTELTRAVQVFQLRHNLEADGVVGKGTLAALNVPVTERIEQIRVNLERSRWVLRNLPDTFVIVDIAGFSLQYRHQGRLCWTTRVVVGQPYHQTPIFRSEIRQIVANPTWTVPVGIANREIVPQILKTPGYLAKERMRILDASGREIPPSQIDFRQYTGKNFPYAFRQDAGPESALGLVKFNIENPFSVYLHDTPSKDLFGRTSRAFSHGCIRVQDPLRLASLLLGNDADNPGGFASFERMLEKGKTATIPLRNPVPVILMYWTAEARDGVIWFRPDLYDRDKQMIQALDAPPDESTRLRQEPISKLRRANPLTG
jgi:murein L,D-transpeptidase YcbB/YkuD